MHEILSEKSLLWPWLDKCNLFRRASIALVLLNAVNGLFTHMR